MEIRVVKEPVGVLPELMPEVGAVYRATKSVRRPGISCPCLSSAAATPAKSRASSCDTWALPAICAGTARRRSMCTPASTITSSSTRRRRSYASAAGGSGPPETGK